MVFLKYIDRPFYWCQKIAKKWWLSWSYLELEEAKIPRETATTTATMMATTTTAMATATTTTLKTKVHSQGFVMIPKNCQKVMVIMVICHLKSCLTFVRAPCNAGFEWEIWKLPLALIKTIPRWSWLNCIKLETYFFVNPTSSVTLVSDV